MKYGTAQQKIKEEIEILNRRQQALNEVKALLPKEEVKEKELSFSVYAIFVLAILFTIFITYQWLTYVPPTALQPIQPIYQNITIQEVYPERVIEKYQYPINATNCIRVLMKDTGQFFISCDSVK